MIEGLVLLMVVAAVVLLVGGLFSAGGLRGPWPSVLWFFLLLFVGTLALGIWARPMGPEAWGVPWLNFLVGAVLIALLIAAAAPDYRNGERRIKGSPLEDDTGVERGGEITTGSPPQESPETVGAVAAVGVFFWIFLVVALGLTVFLLVIDG